MADQNATAGGDAGLASDAERLASLMDAPEPEEQDEEQQDSAAPDPGAEDDAPADEQASGEDEEQADPDQPAIDPPSSWDAEAKERFKALPRDVQELISARDRESNKAVSQRLQEAAEARKAIEAKQAEAAQMREAYQQQLVQLLHHMDATVPEQFRQIKSQADLVRLAKENPALVTEFNAWREQRAAFSQQLEQVEQQRLYEAQQQHQERLAHELELTAKFWPQFMDEKEGPAIHKEIRSLGKALNFSDDEIDGIGDHRTLMLVRLAIEGKRALEARQKAKTKVEKKLPKVVKPGSGDAVGRRGAVDRQSAIRIARSGNMDAVSAQLAKMLS